MKKRLYTTVLSASILLTSAMPSFAAYLDHTNTATDKFYDKFAMVESRDAQFDVVENAKDFVVEGIDGQNYSYLEVVEKIQTGKSFNQLVEEGALSPVGSVENVTLAIETNDEDNILTSDGADNMVITVKAMRDGKVAKDVEGLVRFISLKGAKFAKEEVALDKGVAQVQLTSKSSPVAIEDTIIAAMSNSNDPEFDGKRVEMKVMYLPEGSDLVASSQVFPTYAESESADHLFIRFNKAMDFERIYDEWYKNREIIKVTQKFGNDVKTRTVKGISKLSDKVIKVDFEENSVATGTNENHDVLTDNKLVTVETKSTGIKGVFMDSSISFNLVDHKPAGAMDVFTPSQRTIVAKFNEAVTEGTAEVAGNWVLNGTKLTADHVDGIKVGNMHEGEIVRYKALENGSILDNRGLVYIKLSDKGLDLLKAPGRQNLLQAYNIGDYASLSDTTGQNIAVTQEFEFVTPEKELGQIDLVKESPEQFRIDIENGVSKELEASDIKFEYQTGVKKDGEKIWKTLKEEDYDVKINESKTSYILELTRDWTQILDTDRTGVSYYTKDKDHVRFTLKVKGLSDEWGNKYDENFEKVIKLELDSKSPEHLSMEQVVRNGEHTDEIKVVMDEPIQMNAKNHKDDIIKNSKNLTPSQEQKENGGVPVVTFEFVNEDKSKTLEGELVSLSVDDKTFVIRPKDTNLDAGVWTVYIRSISDDIGNTATTISEKLNIIKPEAEVGEGMIIWADAHDDSNISDDFDYIHIQYGTEMSIDAIKTRFYDINGKKLPTGVDVTSKEANYFVKDEDNTYRAMVGTRVTIKAPKDFIDKDAPNMLNVSKELTDDEGKALKGKHEVELPYILSGDHFYGVDTTNKLDHAVLPADITTIDGDLTVGEEDANEYKNITINGNLYVNADTTLENVTVNGDIYLNSNAKLIINGVETTVDNINILEGRVARAARLARAGEPNVLTVELGAKLTVNNDIVVDTKANISVEGTLTADKLYINADDVKFAGDGTVAIKETVVEEGITQDESTKGEGFNTEAPEEDEEEVDEEEEDEEEVDEEEVNEEEVNEEEVNEEEVNEEEVNEEEVNEEEVNEEEVDEEEVDEE